MQKIKKDCIEIKIKLLSSSANMPTLAYENPAGFDLYASEKIILARNNIKIIKTGIAMQIPETHYGQIEERSGFSLANNLKLKAGVIDSDYRGEVGIIMQNCGDEPITIMVGDKIAQMIIHEKPLIKLEQVDVLDNTERSDKGFGSSNK